MGPIPKGCYEKHVLFLKRIRHYLDLNDRWEWRVIYPDGQKTYRISQEEARSLREAFGGKIIFDPR